MAILKVVDRIGAVHTIDAPDDMPLMFVLRDHAGLPVEGMCGGCASCGTCHVFIDEEWIERLPRPQPDEQGMAEQLYHYDERASRLSCQIQSGPAIDGLELRLAPEE
jgi:2Fe-2S ferredoxin